MRYLKIDPEQEREGNIIQVILLILLLIVCVIPGKAQLVRKERHDIRLNKKVVYYSHKNECVFYSQNGDSLCFTIIADSLSPSFLNIYFVAKYPPGEILAIPFEPLELKFENGKIISFDAQTYYRHNNSVEYSIRYDDLKTLYECKIDSMKFQNSSFCHVNSKSYVMKFFESLAKI